MYKTGTYSEHGSPVSTPVTVASVVEVAGILALGKLHDGAHKTYDGHEYKVSDGDDHVEPAHAACIVQGYPGEKIGSQAACDGQPGIAEYGSLPIGTGRIGIKKEERVENAVQQQEGQRTDPRETGTDLYPAHQVKRPAHGCKDEEQQESRQRLYRRRGFLDTGDTKQVNHSICFESSCPRRPGFLPGNRLGHEVVFRSIGDADLGKVPYPQVVLPGRYHHLIVYLRRVVLRTAHEVVSLLAVDQYAQGLPDTLLVAVERYIALDRHQRLHSLRLDLGRYIVLQRIGGRILLMGILEHTQPLKLHLADEVAKLSELLLCLSRETDEHGGPYGDIGHYSTGMLDQSALLVGSGLAVHALEYSIRRVLQGYVEVVADLGQGGHSVKYLHGKLARVGIVQADPLDALYAAELLQQLGQAALLVDVEPIICELLGDQHDLAYSLPGQEAGLVHQALYGAGYVLAPHERYGAERTGAVAAFGYLEIGIVPRCAEHTLADELVAVVGVEPGQQGGHIHRTEIGVYLGYLLLQVVLVPLRQTAGHIQLVDMAAGLLICVVQDGLYGLLLGQVDEAAGIHYDDIGVAPLLFVCYIQVVAAQLGDDVLGVHGVLGAPQCDHIDLVRSCRFGFQIRFFP